MSASINDLVVAVDDDGDLMDERAGLAANIFGGAEKLEAAMRDLEWEGWTAQPLIEYIESNGLTPDHEFAADAGRDYGHVEAWLISDPGDRGYAAWAVRYGDNATTRWGHYEGALDDDGLAAWLESPDLAVEDAMLQTATVRGIGALPEPDEDSDEYRIIVSHDYYDGTSQHSYAVDEVGNPLEYATLAEAEAAAEEMDEGVYVTQHNESGRPTYTVVSL